MLETFFSHKTIILLHEVNNISIGNRLYWDARSDVSCLHIIKRSTIHPLCGNTTIQYITQSNNYCMHTWAELCWQSTCILYNIYMHVYILCIGIIILSCIYCVDCLNYMYMYIYTSQYLILQQLVKTLLNCKFRTCIIYSREPRLIIICRICTANSVYL